MDADVSEFLLMLLASAPLEVRGTELAKLADVHARAVAQVRELAAADESEAGSDG